MKRMKKIDLQYQQNGMTTLIGLFNSILEKSNYNLNQFVKGDSLEITENTSEELLKELNEFMNMAPVVIRELEEEEIFWSNFEQLDDYEKNNKFVKWLSRYVEASVRPYQDAKFLLAMEQETLENMTNYCFANLIMKDIGKRNIDKSWDEKQIIIFRKIMFTFIEMVVMDNFSKETVFANMERIFGIKELCCEMWWNLVEENEEELWKIMLGKQLNRMEKKLNNILDTLKK